MIDPDSDADSDPERSDSRKVASLGGRRSSQDERAGLSVPKAREDEKNASLQGNIAESAPQWQYSSSGFICPHDSSPMVKDVP